MNALRRLATALGKILQVGFGLPDVVGIIEQSVEAKGAFDELRGIPQDELSVALAKHLDAYLTSGRRNLAARNEYESATGQVARLMENKEVADAAAVEAIARPAGLAGFLATRPEAATIRRELPEKVEPFFDETLRVVAGVLAEMAPTNPQIQQQGVRATLLLLDDIRERLGTIEMILRQGPANLRDQLWLAEDVRAGRTENFVGRGFAFDAIDERLRQARKGRSGYLVIRGQPGIGKSALIAEFVRLRDCVFHFNVAPAGVTAPRRMLLNLSAQLILRYGLGPQGLPYQNLPADAGLDATWLSRLLGEAAAKAATLGEWPVVVVVDALDEADAPVGSENRLKLPRELPDGVVVVATIRKDVDDGLDVSHRFDRIVLNEEDPLNRADIRAYVAEALTRNSALAEQSTRWASTPEEFAAQIDERSQGNFMYVVQVLGGIADGVITHANWGDTLPEGLTDYYRRHWRLMHSADIEWFERVQRPVICMLAIAPYPLTADEICGWITDSHQFDRVKIREVQRVLAEWRQFLVAEDTNPSTWRLYHRSFADFLASDEADGVDLDEYRRASVAATKSKIDRSG